MNEKRFTFDYDYQFEIYDNQTKKHYDGRIGCQEKLCDLLNSLSEENEQLKNELMKEKSLREYSDSMYDTNLIVNIRFSYGEWKADVSVIDDE